MLLFGADMWVVTHHIGRVMGGLQDQVARWLTGRLPRQRLDGRWEYTLEEVAREDAGFELMETYIQQMQNTVTDYIATRPILDLCKAAERKRGTWVGIRWWEQEGLELAGERETTAAAAEVDDDGLGE